MATTKRSKKPVKKKSTTRRSAAKKSLPVSRRKKISIWLSGRRSALKKRIKNFMSRRPHRSFRRTYRYDYVRSLALPGYVSFTTIVAKRLWRYRKTFGLLTLIYAVAIIAFQGVTNQSTYTQLGALLSESGGELLNGVWGSVGEAGLLLLTMFTGGSGAMTSDQGVMLGIILLFVWMTTVWLHREFSGGRKPKLRDGLYNAGAPMVSSLVVALILLLQLLPIGIMATIYAGLSSANLLADGFGAMLFSLLSVTVASLVLYWIVSTIVALVVVTLPGMYPLRAMKAAGDLVIGRRLRILYRLIWMMLVSLIVWMIVMIPVILLESWARGQWSWLASVPIVPFIAAVMSALTVVWMGSYVYLLYRKVVDDDAKPA